ncbi:hypothetical protein JAAARDRAFT_48521 [Jaapia argillacea MUCL 33604]|uniref:Uncharacterized protein n=1 Tax=Jaapia argillacea MUCL 33604 TaxID=933084 RepID=A0A067PYZ8_9AGAM|nr:hypothetical protein JAAARDRAFT_48521 [Jaapia argillacea MUCL 33604]
MYNERTIAVLSEGQRNASTADFPIIWGVEHVEKGGEGVERSCLMGNIELAPREGIFRDGQQRLVAGGRRLGDIVLRVWLVLNRLVQQGWNKGDIEPTKRSWEAASDASMGVNETGHMVVVSPTMLSLNHAGDPTNGLTLHSTGVQDISSGWGPKARDEKHTDLLVFDGLILWIFKEFTIIQLVPETHDLAILCQVSRMFNREASPSLYRSVEFFESPKRQQQFFQTVTSSAALGTYVIVAMLDLTPHAGVDVAHVVNGILRVVPNLRELFLSSLYPNSSSSIFSGCQFKLHILHNHAINIAGTLSFLVSQPDIHEWRHNIPFGYDGYDEDIFSPMHPDILPNVSIMDIDPEILQDFLGPLPSVTHLRLRFQRETENIDYFQLLELIDLFPNVVSLSLDLKCTHVELGSSTALGIIAETLPHLKHLCLLDNDHQLHSRAEPQAAFWQFMDDLSPLSDLETLVYVPPEECRIPEGGMQPWWRRLHSKEGESQDWTPTAELLLSSAPSLKKVAFPREPRESFFHPLSSYIKTHDSQVHQETARPLSTSSWNSLS